MASNTSYITSACTVYCEGPLLQAIQLSGIYNDSKTFVDMPMIYGPQETLSAFDLVNVNNKTALEVFLNDYFLPAGSDLDSWVPADYTTTPDILNRITDPSFYTWASDLNNLWLVLGRQVNESVLEYPEKHSYLPRKYPMMVPGGRFRESYYWDSWFIIRGLLVCDMYDTALNVINNLLDDILNFGFVPNGGRIYYLDRSQPPVLSEMVLDYYTYMEGKFGLTDSLESFMIGAYSSLQTEYAWWMNQDYGHTVNMGNGAVLNRYFSNYTTPRPESYAADYQNTSLPGISEAFALYYYHNKRAGAETGWDYSSRWLKGQYDINAVATSEIIPVELNCILFKFEQNLVTIGNIVNSFPTSRRHLRNAATSLTLVPEDTYPSLLNYTAQAAARKDAIQTYLWDESRSHWWDYNISAQAFAMLGSSDGSSVSIASWIPLWAGIMPSSTQSSETVADQLVASLEASTLVQVAGVRTTTLLTGQQWDSPNAWPPLVWLTIQGLRNLNTSNSINLASSISTRWLNTCMIAYDATDFMYEKYNAFEVGVGGGGGEYVPQIGFGWSNAVALMLLNDLYPAVVSAPTNDDGSSSNVPAWLVAIIVILVLGVLVVMGYFFRMYHVSASQAKQQAKSDSVMHIQDAHVHNDVHNVIVPNSAQK